MDYLWSPWRYQYISTVTDKPERCIFCAAAAENRDKENLIIHRAQHNFVILNRYPYTSGHLMVVPYSHVGTLQALSEQAVTEMALLIRRSEGHLRRVYRAEGLNAGLNEGRCAGAGIADHIHAHVLPRWTGDANFMTTVGETRVLPEDLAVTYDRLSQAFREA